MPATNGTKRKPIGRGQGHSYKSQNKTSKNTEDRDRHTLPLRTAPDLHRNERK